MSNDDSAFGVEAQAFSDRNEADDFLPAHPYSDFDNGEEIENDLNYMKQLYPKEVLHVYSLVSDECDRMEFDGSPMYDQYPDRNYLDLIWSPSMMKPVICPPRIYFRMRPREVTFTRPVTAATDAVGMRIHGEKTSSTYCCLMRY